MNATANQEEKAALVVKRTLHAVLRYQNRPVLEANVAYPQLSAAGGAAAGAVNSFYRQWAEACFNRARQSPYDAAVKALGRSRREGIPFRPFAASAVYEVACNQNGLLSIFTDVCESAGEERGDTVRVSQTWELGGGARLPLSGLFYGNGFRASLCREIMQQISVQIQQGTAFGEDWGKNVFRCLNDENFYLTPSALAVYYPAGSVAPRPAGILTFLIPFEKLGGLRFTRGSFGAIPPGTVRLP